MCPPDEEHVDTDGENFNNTAEICVGSCWAGSHDWPSGVLGESSELGRQCSHYMVLGLPLSIDPQQARRKEQNATAFPHGQVSSEWIR